MKRKFQLQTKM